MQRRDFLKLAGLAAGIPLAAQEMQMQSFLAPTGPQDVAKTEFTLQIGPVTVELAPNRILSTIGYNGTSPGPLLRMKEGVPVTVNVVNNTDVPETVHFHGLLIPSDVDGSEEEGTPVVPPHGTRSYKFTPTPAGTRWYHTHTMSMEDLHRGSYTGMFGFLVVEGASDAGRYDQEHYLALRDWEPYFTNTLMDNDDLDRPLAQPEKPAVLDTRPAGMEVASDIFSINDKALGAGEPIRVNRGERVMFHFLNASAIENRHLALPGHKFNVVALDGNPVPASGGCGRADARSRRTNRRMGGDEPAWRLDTRRARKTPSAKAASASSSNTPISIERRSGQRPEILLGLHDLRQAALAAGPFRKAGYVFEKVPRGSANSTPSRSTANRSRTNRNFC